MLFEAHDPVAGGFKAGVPNKSLYDNVSRVLTMKGLRNLTDVLGILSDRPSIQRILRSRNNQFTHYCLRLHLMARAAFYVVLPHPPSHGQYKRPLSGCARQIIKNIKTLASSIWGADFGILTIEPKNGRILMFGRDHRIDLSSLFQGNEVIFLVNPSFLLLPEHPLREMLSAAQNHNIAIRTKHFGRSLYAVAINRSMMKHPLLNQALSCLVAYEDLTPKIAQSHHDNVKFVHGGRFGEHEFSPAVEGASSLNCKRSSISPFYLNKALLEVLYFPVNTAQVNGSPERMRQALLAQRERSAVPWIFNVLTNQIEYRMGKVIMDTFPSEIHLSITGRCNIECRFCSYTHNKSKNDHVGIAQMQNLDFLEHLHTVRLSSGLGEPTINPNFGAIVEYVATEFPHIDINFSTNGIALNDSGLVNQLINRVAYINVSLNAATPHTWRELCRRDLFDRVCSNLRNLQLAKRKAAALLPLVYGSMVLTTKNICELPDMPGLCRSLGVDRFTGIPFFAFNYNQSEKYGVAETFHQCYNEYERIYERTIQEARRHRVSIEIPVPQDRKRVGFGVEERGFYDFARIEEPPPRLDTLVDGLRYEAPNRKACPDIWKIAYISATHLESFNRTTTHFLYPCIGPLSAMDFSMKTPFRFPDRDAFLQLWNSPLYKRLRKAQIMPEVSRICDLCRKIDSRDPSHFKKLEGLLNELEPQLVTRSADHLPL
jgi:MoaA/NifB/PqqE/SkfB family radical SAM enzyme